MNAAQPYPADVAGIYDVVFPDFTERLTPRIYSVFERKYGSSHEGTAMLDLCCGSGAVARYFAQRGVESFGVDVSEPMIEAAGRASAGLANAPRFIVAEASRFTLPRRVSLCAATFTAMNHFETREHFCAVTRRVLEHLEPGGTFIFDLKTRVTLDQFNGDVIYDREDSFQIWRHMPDKARGRTVISVNGFVRDAGATQYRRYAHVYTLQTYPLADVREWMLAQGWSDVVFTGYDDLETPFTEAERASTVMVIAASPAGGVAARPVP